MQARELLKNIPSPQPLLDSVLEHVASMYAAIDKPEEAIPLFARSLDIQKSVYGEYPHCIRHLPRRINNLGPV